MQQFHQLLAAFSKELDAVMRENDAEAAKAERRAKRESRRVSCCVCLCVYKPDYGGAAFSMSVSKSVHASALSFCGR
jgi:hypothetical protein